MDRVLYDLDLFLREYPNYPTREEKKDAKGADLPIKTIKTIAHSLARLKGDKVCCFRLIETIKTIAHSLARLKGDKVYNLFSRQG